MAGCVVAGLDPTREASPKPFHEVSDGSGMPFSCCDVSLRSEPGKHGDGGRLWRGPNKGIPGGSVRLDRSQWAVVDGPHDEQVKGSGTAITEERAGDLGAGCFLAIHDPGNAHSSAFCSLQNIIHLLSTAMQVSTGMGEGDPEWRTATSDSCPLLPARPAP